MPQWIVKGIIVVAYLLPAAWVLFLAVMLSWRVIRSEYVTLAWLNPFRVSERYVAAQLEGKARVADAIYQDEMIVGRLVGEPEIDEDAKTVVFPRLIRTDNLEPGRPFVFRSWEVELVPPNPSVGAVTVGGTMIIGGDKVSLPEVYGRVLEQAHCRIIRRLL